MTTMIRLRALTGALLLALPFFSAQAAEFVYGGTLQDGNAPADGVYDFKLTPYASADGGTALSAPIALHGVAVHAGAFTASVDLGAAVAPGGSYWIAAEVAPAGSGDFAAVGARTQASIDAPATCNGTWALDGNAGNPGGSFLGTVDDNALVFKMNNTIVGSFDPSTDANVPDAPNVIFGGALNGALGAGATIAGGGRPVSFCGTAGTSSCSNSVLANYGSIGGGRGNGVGGYAATIPGGADNVAIGSYSFAGGHFAVAENDGSFVWSDNAAPVQFGADVPVNGFAVRAIGGATFVSAIDGNGNPFAGVHLAAGSGSWSNLSDRNAKTGIATIDVEHVLDRVVSMPISTWQYSAQSADIRHIGPMAQDFFAAFNVGEDERHITDVDEGGVALAAIQGLNRKLETENASLRTELEDLRTRVERVLDAQGN